MNSAQKKLFAYVKSFERIASTAGIELRVVSIESGHGSIVLELEFRKSMSKSVHKKFQEVVSRFASQFGFKQVLILTVNNKERRKRCNVKATY